MAYSFTSEELVELDSYAVDYVEEIKTKYDLSNLPDAKTIAEWEANLLDLAGTSDKDGNVIRGITSPMVYRMSELLLVAYK